MRRAFTRRARHRNVGVQALPDFVELVIVGIRAGLAPARAVTVAAQQAPEGIRPAVDEVVHRLERGARLADALTAMPDVLGSAANSFSDGLGTADRYGLALEPVLDRLASDALDHRRREAERHSRTLPVRLSFPLVVCTLPSFVLLAIAPALLGAISTLRHSGI
ncbi:MAG TPA: type II secretion system F family protein [Ilumatobacter sp.]|nr:type II secretion system F family protein [Ilumatobacter sp.]